MKKIIYISIYIVYFVILKWFVLAQLGRYVRFSVFYGSILSVPFVLFAAWLLTYATKVLLIRQFSQRMLNVFKVTYFLSLIYLLFLKGIGVQGFQPNPLSFIHEFLNDDWVMPTMNIVYFIPLGFFCRTRIEFLRMLLFILIAESIQYLFSLGVFDFGDIVANYIGIYLGTKLIHPIKHFFRMTK